MFRKIFLPMCKFNIKNSFGTISTLPLCVLSRSKIHKKPSQKPKPYWNKIYISSHAVILNVTQSEFIHVAGYREWSYLRFANSYNYGEYLYLCRTWCVTCFLCDEDASVGFVRHVVAGHRELTRCFTPFLHHVTCNLGTCIIIYVSAFTIYCFILLHSIRRYFTVVVLTTSSANVVFPRRRHSACLLDIFVTLCLCQYFIVYSVELFTCCERWCIK